MAGLVKSASIFKSTLMHSPNPDPSKLAAEREGHRKMHANYLKQRVMVEFYALALFTRTVLRVA